ncbi:MAG: polysaccharide lyase family protein, partial [Tepidisphaeraceae bacterium]
MTRRTRWLLSAAVGASFFAPSNLRADLTFNFSNASAWTLSNGIVSLTFNSTTGTFTNISALLGGTDYSIVNSSVAMPNLNHGSATSALYAQDNGGGVAGTASYYIGSNYIDIWEDDPPTNTQTPGLDIQSHYILEDNTAGISAYTVVSHSASAQAVTGYGGDFVIKTDDLNLTQLDYSNYNVNDLGSFQANFPSYYAQAAAAGAAGSGRNVQNETIDYNGFTYDGQNIQSEINEAYEMANGATGVVNRQFITKYDYATAAQFQQVDGYVGTDGLGVWSVYPSTESLAGGPDDVNIMGVSSGPMETLGWASDHLGGSSYNPPTGVNSSRMFGPFYIGLNAMPGTNLTTNLADATALSDQEAAQIPSLKSFYDTESELVSSGYVPSTERGDMTATATTSGAWSSNPYGNLVILADNDVNFQNSNLGDEYWGYINPATDQVSIPSVVPGTYRLSIVELGQWGETRLNNVAVGANLNTVIQGVKFTPENFGTSIWTIGTPDRSSQEFEYGNVGNGGPANNNYLGAYDYWGGLANSPVPGAVVYYATAVGSTPATNNLNDWPFNYWQVFDPALYAGVFTNGADTTDDGYNYVVQKTAPYVDANGGSPATYKGPDWQVHFTVTPQQLSLGRYLDLSVGLVAAESSLIVALNGHQLVWHYANLSGDDPMERSGTTGYYQWIVYQWDTSDLNPAGQDDELTFGLSQGEGVMWDALRMEISATGANPTTTGWHDYEFLYDSTDTPVNDALGANNGGAVSMGQSPDESAWLLSSGGTWGAGGNWASGAAPNEPLDTADLTSAITAPTVITLDGPRT